MVRPHACSRVFTLVIGWPTVPLASPAQNKRLGKGLGRLWLTPVSRCGHLTRPVVFIGIAALWRGLRVFHSRKTALTRVPVWDCGFERLTNRMQYNSTSFAMPLRRIFGFFLKIKESVTPQDPNAPIAFQRKFIYRLTINDRLWYISSTNPFPRRRSGARARPDSCSAGGFRYIYCIRSLRS